MQFCSKYVQMRRRLIAHDAQRKPSTRLSGSARGEVDYLIARLAKRYERAAL